MSSGNRVLFLWPWIPNKSIQRLKLEAIPVWVGLPNLIYHYFNSYVLSGLGKLIGKLVFIDKLTTTQARMVYTRTCMEIKLGDPTPKTIHFTDEYGVECSLEMIYKWMSM